MRKITSFDRVAVRALDLNRQIADALKPLAEEYGFVVTIGRGHFDSNQIEYPVALRIGDLSQKTAQDKTMFEAFCGQYGLAPEDFGRRIVDRGTIYEVAGVNPGRPKFAIRCTRLKDSKELLFPADRVRELLGKAA